MTDLDEGLAIAHYPSDRGEISYDVLCDEKDAVGQAQTRRLNRLHQKTERCACFSLPERIESSEVVFVVEVD